MLSRMIANVAFTCFRRRARRLNLFLAAREQFDSDGMLRRAIKDFVHEIGEAAARTSDLGRARVLDLPWGKIVAMRHILVHAYFGIDWDTIWNVTQEHLPAMIRTLESALKKWEQEQSR